MENGSRFSVAFIIMSTCPRSSGTGQISHDYPGLGWEHVVRGSGSPSRGMKGLVEIVRITPETATEQKCVRTKNVFGPDSRSLKKNTKTTGKHEAGSCLAKQFGTRSGTRPGRGSCF